MESNQKVMEIPVTIPDLYADYEAFDFSNFGRRINLGETVIGPDEELRYMASLLGISIHTNYLILDRNEFMNLYRLITKLNDQADLLLECESTLRKADQKVKAAHAEADLSYRLNWIFIPTTGVLLIIIGYLIFH